MTTLGKIIKFTNNLEGGAQSSSEQVGDESGAAGQRSQLPAQINQDAGEEDDESDKSGSVDPPMLQIYRDSRPNQLSQCSGVRLYCSFKPAKIYPQDI